MKCQICNRECTNFISLGSHLKSHNLKSKDYYDLYLKKENEGICSECGKETKFVSIGEGYREYCSNKCSNRSEDTKKKSKQTLMNHYGVDSFSKTEEYLIKTKKTYLNKYGVDHPLKNKEIKDKIKNTCLNKYGVDNPMKDDKIKDKLKNSLIEKYNVDNYSKTKDFKEKFKNTCLERYNVDNPNKLKEIRSKIENTCIEKYGTYYPLYNKEINKKRILSFKKTVLKNFYNNLFNSDRLKGLVIPLFDLKDYKGVYFKNKYLFKCVKCNNEFETYIDNGRIPRCLKCFPYSKSSIENKCYEFLLTLLNDDEIQRGNRNVLNGLELDIYIPSKSLAIELNGLYWHSELGANKLDRNYHIIKTNECIDQRIQLLHIFEDEWIEKQEIVKSIIKSKLGLINNKIYARKCKIDKISKVESENFLNENHIQGFINGTHLGLYYNNELVSILTYGVPRFNKSYDVEILRFCNKLNTIVIGGLSKLVKHIESDSIISYCDLRYGDGHSYEKCGFKKIGISKPNYYYLKGLTRLNRMQFQKHKLKDKLNIFDPNLTEWQNMQLNGYDRIWDCGNLIYTNYSMDKN